MNLGHLWFLEHLFIYSLLLVTIHFLWSKITNNYSYNRKIGLKNNSLAVLIIIVILVTILTLIAFIMRNYHSLTEMSAFLGFIQTDYTHVGQHVVLFFTGFLLAKINILSKIDVFSSYILFIVTILLNVFVFIIFYYLPAYQNIFRDLLLLSSWESLTAVTFILGTMSFLNYKIPFHSQKISDIANQSFIVYIIHVLFVVLFQIVAEDLFTDIIVKLLFVTTFSLIFSFIGAFLLKKISVSRFLRKKSSCL